MNYATTLSCLSCSKTARLQVPGAVSSFRPDCVQLDRNNRHLQSWFNSHQLPMIAIYA